MRLTGDWGQPMFVMGSHIFALSQDGFLSLEWEQSTNIKNYPCPKYYLKTFQIHENPCRFRPRDRTTNIDKVGIGLHSVFPLLSWLSQPLWRPRGVINVTNRELLGVHWNMQRRSWKKWFLDVKLRMGLSQSTRYAFISTYSVPWNVGLLWEIQAGEYGAGAQCM